MPKLDAQEKDLSKFWLKRFKKTGHTGWSDATIYAYDQIERLEIVSQKLNTLKLISPQVIDFGCGTGDFSRLMLSKGFTVWGYDPFVQPKITDKNFTYIAERNEFERLDVKVDLVLSITVLDHILSQQELNNTLTCLRDKASNKGILLMLEYALDKHEDLHNKYQAFRTVEDWKQILIQTGWGMEEIISIPHPKSAPSKGYSQYKKNTFVRLLRKLSHKSYFVSRLTVPMLMPYARSVLKKQGATHQVTNSPLKLIFSRLA